MKSIKYTASRLPPTNEHFRILRIYREFRFQHVLQSSRNDFVMRIQDQFSRALIRPFRCTLHSIFIPIQHKLPLQNSNNDIPSASVVICCNISQACMNIFEISQVHEE